MMLARHFMAIGLFCASALLLPAEEPKPGAHSRPAAGSGELTLEKAVEIALRQNPEILRAVQEIERTQGQVIAVRAEALPRLSLSGSYSQRDPGLTGGSVGRVSSTAAAAGSAGSPTTAATSGNSFDQLGGTTAQTGASGSVFSAQEKSWRVAVQARQALYAGGRVRAAVRSAQFTEDRAYWELRETIDRVIASVRGQFYTVLLNRALIGVQEESISLLGAQLKDQQDRFKAGAVARFNVLQAEVALSNARPELIRARNNYLVSQLQLFKTLGLPPQPEGRPALRVVGTLEVAPRLFDVSEALRIARERRGFLKAQRQNILIEAEQIKVALAGYLPRLDANAGYQLRNSRLSEELDDVVQGWFYGLSGRWQVFDGLATDGRVKQARARLESAKIGYDDAVLQVDLEVQQAHARLQTARETMASQQKSVEQAAEALRLASIRFAAGAGIQLEVLDARVALTRARTTALQARADYHIALADFDRATATDTIYEEAFNDPLTRRPRTNAPATPRAK